MKQILPKLVPTVIKHLFHNITVSFLLAIRLGSGMSIQRVFVECLHTSSFMEPAYIQVPYLVNNPPLSYIVSCLSLD